MKYRLVLEDGGTVRMRTDSTPFRDFSLTQLNLAGYQLEWETDDVRGMFPDEPWSGYERKLVAKGAPVVRFLRGAGTCSRACGANRSALARELSSRGFGSLDYIPFGMQGSIDNIVGYNANRRKKGLPDWRPPIV